MCIVGVVPVEHRPDDFGEIRVVVRLDVPLTVSYLHDGPDARSVGMTTVFPSSFAVRSRVIPLHSLLSAVLSLRVASAW